MRRTIGRWLVGSAAIAVAAVAIQGVAQAAVTFNQQIPFDVIIANPCAPFNDLEAIGNIHIVFRFTESASGTDHGDFWSNLDSFEATDTITGAKYESHQNGQTQGQGKYSFNEPVGAAFEGTITVHAGLEGQGSLPNLNFEMQEHITIPPGGGLGASISNFRFTCQ